MLNQLVIPLQLLYRYSPHNEAIEYEMVPI